MNLRLKFNGAKHSTEATDCVLDVMVGEHCGRLRRYIVRSAGGSTRAYVDTSSDKTDENSVRRKPKVSCATLIGAGLVGS